jgi:hypothetical protein
MLLFKFESATTKALRFGVTSQRSAANLPTDGAPWRFVSAVDVRPTDGSSLHIGAPSNRVLAAIAEDGYFVWLVHGAGEK